MSNLQQLKDLIWLYFMTLELGNISFHKMFQRSGQKRGWFYRHRKNEESRNKEQQGVSCLKVPFLGRWGRETKSFGN
jgi:hypothetical protein